MTLKKGWLSRQFSHVTNNVQAWLEGMKREAGFGKYYHSKNTMSNYNLVKDWHTKFGVPVAHTPKLISKTRQELRLTLIDEELRELREAMAKDDLVEIADALADLEYVLHGTAIEYGIPQDDVFAEVHRSNMSKLWPDGKPRYRKDGKVLKPSTYSPANIKPILNAS